MHLSVAVRLSVRPPHADVAGLLLWARRAADIDRLLHGRRAAANAPQQRRAAAECLG